MITTVSDKEIAQAAEIEALRQEVTAWSITVANLEAKLAEANQLEIHRCDHIGILKNNCDEMELELATIKAKLAALEQTHAQRFVELTRLRQHVTGLELQEPFELGWPDYHPEGMGCGLEDRNITDRYEAMQYGWEQALEHVAERLPERLFLAAGAAPVPEGWQPIETAPKDGLPFRAYSKDLIDLDFNPNGSVECCWYGAEFVGCVWDGQQDAWYGKAISFTHWMPIPSAPKEQTP